MIVQARPDDLAGVMVVERAGFATGAWSEAAWLDELAGADRLVLVHRDAADEIDAAATFQVVGDTADLHRVVVHPVARRRGVASVLVADGLAWAAQHGADRMLLEVEHTNTPALSLYAGLGFTEIARRADYYGAGAHAIVMARELEAHP